MPAENALAIDEIMDISEPDSEGINRRRCFRLETILPLSIRVQGEHGEMTEPTGVLTTDLSVTGLSFISDTPIQPCSLLDVTIKDLPYMDELSIPADVVRCKEFTTDAGSKAYFIGADFKAYLNRHLRTELQRSVTVLQRMKEHKSMPIC